MSLQEFFYLFSIAFFLSVWLVLILAMIALYALTRKFRQAKDEWQKNIFSKPLTMAAGSLPLLTVIAPLIKRTWQWWQQKRANKRTT